ncbi:MAG TPA: pyridoxal-dependent decarboxylase [Cyclobacteriaceae bacterium]|jgi:glutamate/tyrosine decarboxylase-like PLP-dependent enzyme|nr:pyridoxal-dependent decarboxylase [Cyclobacteriaceae bacterium]
MNSLLQNDYKNLSKVLSQTQALAEEYFKIQDDFAPGRFVKNIEMPAMPEKGMGAEKTLQFFRENYAHLITNSAGPRYFGFVTGGSTPAAIAGDWLVSSYDQNNCGSNDSIAPQLERQTINFLRQIFGLDENHFGSFTTGATVSNFVGLSLARQWAGEKLGFDFSETGLTNLSKIKIVSSAAHSSIFKSLSMLGLGRKSLTKIPTLPNREAIDLNSLEDFLKANPENPIILIANAGTVNTVDFDDIRAISQLKSKYNFWLHVDAAFGGFAALSEKFKHLVEGINQADSICVDAHKWLNVPYDAAMQFTRHKDLQLKVFQNSAIYLGDPTQSPDFFHYTPENSRRWRSLPAWFTLMAYGKEGHREIVERNCAMAKKFGDWISTSGNYKLLAEVRMNVVCFTLSKPDISLNEIKDFLSRVRDDGRVFFTPTVYNNTPAIRMAISNWQTESKDIDIAIQVLNEIK